MLWIEQGPTMRASLEVFSATICLAIFLEEERNSLSLYLRDLTGIGELDRDLQATMFMAGLAGIVISVIAAMALSNKADSIERSTKYGTKF